MTISIRPEHYASGLGVNPATNLTHQQLREYIMMAVADDYTWARQVVSTVKSGAKTDAEADVEQQRLNRWSQLATSAGAQATPMATRLADLNSLITEITSYQNANMEVWAEDYTASGAGQVINPPNRDTRYATAPKNRDYKHSRVLANQQSPVAWGSDKEMWELFGAGLGPILSTLQTTNPEDKDVNKPLVQLPWARAKELLPRPLLNLIFDVRYQLDSGGAVVIDERTPAQQARKEKSPSEPGTLRSWHQDSPGVLPGTKLKAQPPAHAAALHTHYQGTSTTGAGSSIVSGATGPVGYAEYTGTGSNWEHNTKVVLDYVRKRVYLTLSHYQYWALIDKNGGGHELWQSDTQERAQAEGKLNEYLKKTSRTPDKATLMSPWMEVLFT